MICFNQLRLNLDLQIGHLLIRSRQLPQNRHLFSVGSMFLAAGRAAGKSREHDTGGDRTGRLRPGFKLLVLGPVMTGFQLGCHDFDSDD